MQSIDMLAAELGFTLDAEKRSTHEMALATQTLDTPVGGQLLRDADTNGPETE